MAEVLRSVVAAGVAILERSGGDPEPLQLALTIADGDEVLGRRAEFLDAAGAPLAMEIAVHVIRRVPFADCVKSARRVAALF